MQQSHSEPQKMKVNIKAISLFSIICLAGCATGASTLTAKEVENHIKVEIMAGGNKVWIAPELQTRHFRTFFYGYDTVYYRLKANKSEKLPNDPVYHLLIDANYGGPERHYVLAKSVEGTSYVSNNLNHEILRCQIFGSMVSSCLYRDRTEVILEGALLETGRHKGLLLTLSSRFADYEQIELPAEYIDGFLQAVGRNLN